MEWWSNQLLWELVAMVSGTIAVVLWASLMLVATLVELGEEYARKNVVGGSPGRSNDDSNSIVRTGYAPAERVGGVTS